MEHKTGGICPEKYKYSPLNSLFLAKETILPLLFNMFFLYLCIEKLENIFF